VVEHWNRLPGEAAVSLLGYSQNPTGHSAGQPALSKGIALDL